MTGLEVVYADKQESKSENQELIWAEYNQLQWLDKNTHHLSKGSSLPLSVHVAPKQMRIDMVFPEHAEIAAKRLYMLAFSKSLTSSVSSVPISGDSDKEQKGLLVSVQGDTDTPDAMQSFLKSGEIHDILPKDAISVMSENQIS